ncbi:hypothetical protein EW026_g4266 [Hermanssonia centrifuga]|uniref:Uncharacterized protein n=1 Tax=Hermanssonia centrifuga TaxID=98765 RepID=A0A4S4KIK2_9APHY|nr:hypothetical protein EW026_g4266 [Hermanssonia centrifuga]
MQRRPTMRHDPEEKFDYADLYNLDPSSNCRVEQTSSTLPDFTWSPYPNESSFRLGEWYWNDWTSKSQASFKKLVNVITAPDFSTEDIQKTKWDVLDRELVLERDETGDGWEDVDGLGWVESPVMISVPFHKKTAHPGTHIAQQFSTSSVVISTSREGPIC